METAKESDFPGELGLYSSSFSDSGVPEPARATAISLGREVRGLVAVKERAPDVGRLMVAFAPLRGLHAY